MLLARVLLQIGALVSRGEAWHLTIRAAGGTVARRVLYRASSMQVLGSVINAQLGVAARIAALRHSSPEVTSQVPPLIAVEVPILSAEAALAVPASFMRVSGPQIGFQLRSTVSAGRPASDRPPDHASRDGASHRRPPGKPSIRLRILGPQHLVTAERGRARSQAG